MAKIKRENFFNSVRGSLFQGKLSQKQVDNLEILLKEAETRKWSDKRHIAYVLATVYGEVGINLEPVREGFAKTDAEAISHVTRLFNSGRISTNYAVKDSETGQSYFGRGYVQLTWKSNYKTMGDILGLDLVNEPSLALEPDVASAIIFEGMERGSFTNGRHKLSTYFNESKTDPVEARRIINGTDKKELFASYYEKFVKAIDFEEESGIIVDESSSNFEERLVKLEKLVAELKKVLNEYGV